MRKGRPRYNVPWSENEAIAFSSFETPNRLAEALSDDDPVTRERAEFSMRSITHVARGLYYFLHSASFVRQHSDRISWIFRQQTLDDDIRHFLAKNCIPLSYEPIQVERDLSYEEIPVQILDRKEQTLRNKTIHSVKVLWRNHNVEEATWELEEKMKRNFPHLFE